MNIPTWASRDGKVKISAIIERSDDATGALIQGTVSKATPPNIRALASEFPGQLDEFIHEDGRLKASIQAFIIDTPEGNILVDTCVGEHKDVAISEEFSQQTHTGFLTRLAEAGYEPDDIDQVLCTHLHFDHIGWNTYKDENGEWQVTFPKARYLFSQKEYEHWQSIAGELKGAIPEERQQFIENYLDTLSSQSIQPVIDAGLVEFVKSDHFINLYVSLKPTPGHTPDHFSVIVKHQDLKAIISGDALHHPCQILRSNWGAPEADSDEKQAKASREMLLQDCWQDGFLLLGTHFAGPIGVELIARGPRSYEIKKQPV